MIFFSSSEMYACTTALVPFQQDEPFYFYCIGSDQAMIASLLLQRSPVAVPVLIGDSPHVLVEERNRLAGVEAMGYVADVFRNAWEELLPTAPLAVFAVNVLSRKQDVEKKVFLDKIHERLKPGGVLIWIDLFLPHSIEVFEKYQLLEAESTELSVEKALREIVLRHRQSYPIPCLLEKAETMLYESGFDNVEVVWKRLGYTAIAALLLGEIMKFRWFLFGVFAVLFTFHCHSRLLSDFGIGIRVENGFQSGEFFPNVYDGYIAVPGISLLFDWNISNDVVLEIAPGFQQIYRGVNFSGLHHKFKNNRFRLDVSGKWFFRPHDWNIGSYLSLGGSFLFSHLVISSSVADPEFIDPDIGLSWRVFGGCGISFYFSCIDADFQVEMLLEGGGRDAQSRDSVFGARLSVALIFQIH